jgi:hypothetical protein
MRPVSVVEPRIDACHGDDVLLARRERPRAHPTRDHAMNSRRLKVARGTSHVPHQIHRLPSRRGTEQPP